MEWRWYILYTSYYYIDVDKDDDKAFIFTLKNPHGVKPIRFMKRKYSKYTIKCNPKNGPIFSNDINYDIFIDDKCNKQNSCLIYNDGSKGYECHPEYKSSLFVNTNKDTQKNLFSVLDYEVFTIDYKSKYTIDHICKYPNIVWEYIQTNDISQDTLKEFYNEIELINDLNAIHCSYKNIRSKISTYSLKNSSEFLPNTQIVSKDYDDSFKEWLENDYKWKLIYRASEHGYTAKSFHEYCDDKGPTLIVIKSSGGWIFGGYTTQSWSGYCKYICIFVFNSYIFQ